ncbi:MAG: AroM family protein [Candidatus Bipolaricaulota bacterium]
MTKIGTVTIGQSPRTDLVPEMEEMLNRLTEIDFEFIEKGALDGLSFSEAQALKPDPQDEKLVTRMKDGREVSVAKSAILTRMQNKIRELEETADLIALLCSGSFPRFEAHIPLLYPHKLLFGTLQAIQIEGALGLMVPSEGQIEELSEEIPAPESSQVHAVAASPYENGNQAVKQAAQELEKRQVDLVVMDCFGYDLQMGSTVWTKTQKPVLVMRSMLVHFLSQLLS